jgi:Protein of unknown function (DUF1553)/Protein of unknown function (DUF1549)
MSMGKRIAIGLIWVVATAAAAAEPATTHWAYVAPVRPTLPAITNDAWTRTAIDRFVLARLQREGLSPSAEAPRAILIRRLSFDLTGLPPSIADVDRFLADSRPDAYERLVDRLLGSPQIGERWARHWLDLARYADSHGFQRDDLRDIWPYRDWVVQALNSDLPFDQFTIDQIAGDLLLKPTEAQRVATGFHRCCQTNVEAGTDPEESRILQVIDRVNTTSTVWLGTTLECAQCHDHKYDPFSQRDYYRMFAYFNSTMREAERANPNLAGSIKFMGPKYAIGNSATQVMQELPKPRVTQVFRRGDMRQPGEQVEPGTPAVLHPLPKGPADRLTLARWLVARDNPLTARVVVNRLWAELFGLGLVSTPEDFGARGERPTHPELLDWLAVEFMDSGWSLKHLLRDMVTSATYRQSSRLTSELKARDPGNKLLARGPRFRLDAEEIRDNALALAGTLNLKMGGAPVRPPQPEGLWAKVSGEKLEYVPGAGPELYRRGIYVVWKRSSPYPSMANFDAGARLTCTVKRLRSNTPLQALTLLNDPVYVEAAHALALRIVRESPVAALDEQLRFGFRLCLAREPKREELDILRALHARQREVHGYDAAWDAIATALLNLDETISRP